jgi:hypothetical protein
MPCEARYLHICEALQHQIGTLPPNTLLASEHDLARRFRVSRVTSGARSGSWAEVGSSRASRWHHREPAEDHALVLRLDDATLRPGGTVRYAPAASDRPWRRRAGGSWRSECTPARAVTG